VDNFSESQIPNVIASRTAKQSPNFQEIFGCFCREIASAEVRRLAMTSNSWFTEIRDLLNLACPWRGTIQGQKVVVGDGTPPLRF
jgi:hypothetical protein